MSNLEADLLQKQASKVLTAFQMAGGLLREGPDRLEFPGPRERASMAGSGSGTVGVGARLKGFYGNRGPDGRLRSYKVIIILQFHNFPRQAFSAKDIYTYI